MNNVAREITAQTLVDFTLKLISFPDILLRLQQVLDDPDHSREQVAEVVKYDTALAARVLRIANSSYYGFAGKIETVEAAVGLVGELDLHNLVMATSMVRAMNSVSYRGVDIDEFWRHSLDCAVLARQVARVAGGVGTEVMFVAGILHDIGILAMYQEDEMLARAVTRPIEVHHQLRDQAERELVGFDHAEVGGMLLAAWNLPLVHCELASCHHQYQLAREYPREALVLALANLVSTGSPALTDPRIDSMCAELRLDREQFASIVEQGQAQAAEIRGLILG